MKNEGADMSTRKTPKAKAANAAKAATALRRIAVHVEEARPGRFAWVLSELSPEADASLAEIARAEKPVRSYQQAMAEGLWALQSMVDDLEQGPREAVGERVHEVASSRGAAASSRKKTDEREDEGEDESEDASDAPPPKGTSRTAFGFGLIG